MTQGETLIIFLLVVIAYFLYQIARQLTFLTGKRMKMSFFKWQINKPQPKKAEKEEKLSN